MDMINVRSSEVMTKAMDGLMVRHKAITSNLANVDTPGYKAIRVDFEDKLRSALVKEDNDPNQSRHFAVGGLQVNHGMLELSATHEKHLGKLPMSFNEVNINTYQDEKVEYRVDQNGVDIDSEMTELAKNSMQFEALATLQSKHFMMMKDTIRQSGGGS